LLHNFQKKARQNRCKRRRANIRKTFSKMNIAIGAPQRNHISTPIELSNHHSELPPATAAGAHLHRRYHVPVGIADLVALLAGLGLEEARQ
jgi:hypothetical protein